MNCAESRRLVFKGAGLYTVSVLILASFCVTGCEKEAQDVTQTIHVIIDTIVTVPNTVQDVDGNNYPVIEIGAQRWMGRNLRTTRFANGDPIPYVPDPQAWNSTSAGAWSIYESDPGYASMFGHLYNHYTVADPRNVCPAGWHVPSDDDWKELESFLGMPLNELDQTGNRGAAAGIGGFLKAEQVWSPPNAGAIDSAGFTALPGGHRNGSSIYDGVGEDSWIWSSTLIDTNTAVFRSLLYDDPGIQRWTTLRKVGSSIRCIED